MTERELAKVRERVAEHKDRWHVDTTPHDYGDYASVKNDDPKYWLVSGIDHDEADRICAALNAERDLLAHVDFLTDLLHDATQESSAYALGVKAGRGEEMRKWVGLLVGEADAPGASSVHVGGILHRVAAYGASPNPDAPAIGPLPPAQVREENERLKAALRGIMKEVARLPAPVNSPMRLVKCYEVAKEALGDE